MRKLFRIIMMIMLLASAAMAQGPKPPTGYMPPYAMLGMGTNGLFKYYSVDANGAMVISGSSGQGSQFSGYPAPFAPVAVDPSGNWSYLHVDSSGALTITGAVPTPPGAGNCLVSTGSGAGQYNWGACSGSASSNFSTLAADAPNTTGGTFQIGNGTHFTTTGTGTIVATAAPIAGLTGAGTGVLTFLGTPTSANLAAALTDETGSGAAVFATSPTLTTPNLGIPSAATLTNATGLPIATGVSGLATGIATFLATPSSANLAAALTNETGSGLAVFATSPTLTTPNLGTPSAATLTNATGLPVSTGISGLATGIATFLGTPSSANLATAVTDETGSGALVFATSPVFTTPNLGTPSAATLTNATGLPISTGVSGLATGIATFLATPSSANLLSAMTTKTGTGSLVFGTSPTFSTGVNFAFITGGTAQCLHVDTAGNLSGTGSDCGSGGGGSGTVTSVGTGFGLSGGPVTVTGTLTNPFANRISTVGASGTTVCDRYNTQVTASPAGVISSENEAVGSILQCGSVDISNGSSTWILGSGGNGTTGIGSFGTSVGWSLADRQILLGDNVGKGGTSVSNTTGSNIIPTSTFPTNRTGGAGLTATGSTNATTVTVSVTSGSTVQVRPGDVWVFNGDSSKEYHVANCTGGTGSGCVSASSPWYAISNGTPVTVNLKEHLAGNLSSAAITPGHPAVNLGDPSISASGGSAQNTRISNAFINGDNVFGSTGSGIGLAAGLAAQENTGATNVKIRNFAHGLQILGAHRTQFYSIDVSYNGTCSTLSSSGAMNTVPVEIAPFNTEIDGMTIFADTCTSTNMPTGMFALVDNPLSALGNGSGDFHDIHGEMNGDSTHGDFFQVGTLSGAFEFHNNSGCPSGNACMDMYHYLSTAAATVYIHDDLCNNGVTNWIKDDKNGNILPCPTTGGLNAGGEYRIHSDLTADTDQPCSGTGITWANGWCGQGLQRAHFTSGVLDYGTDTSGNLTAVSVTSTGPAGDAGMIEFTGNTTNQSIDANKFAIGGFTVTNATAYGIQPSNTAPAANQLMVFGAPVSGWSQWAWKSLAGSGAGITTGPVSGVGSLDVALFTGTGGQITDSGVLGSNLVRKDAANTQGASGSIDMSAVTGTTGFKVPSTTTNTATAVGVLDYDTTNSNYHAYSGADSLIGIVPTASVPANGDVIDSSLVSSKFLLHDSGVATANLVTAASNFTSGGLVYGAAANKTTTSSADWTISSHTLGSGASGILDLHAISVTAGFLLPVAAGAAPTTAEVMAYNSTINNIVWGNGTNTSRAGYFTTAPLGGSCVQTSGTSGLLVETGTACGSGGGGDTITTPNSTLAVGGTSSNTTLDVVGAAGEILAGATPALTYTPIFGVDNSHAGTLQLANGSSNAHTILGSAATTSNTFLFPATVFTNNHVGYCVVSSTTCTFTDAGYAYNSIPNADLANSSVTIAVTGPITGGGAVALGATATAIGCTTCVTSASSLTSTALMTGAGSQGSQTPSATTTLDGSGNLQVAAGGSIGSADTGTPKFTFAANKMTANQPIYVGVTSNQMVFGTTTNLTTVTYPASSGAVTLTMPNVSTNIIGGNSDTTTTHVLHASATGGIGSFSAIATGDLPIAIPIGNIGSAGLSGNAPISIAATGAISCTTCTTAAASLTANQAVNGSGSQAEATGFTDTAGTITAGKLACYTASNTIGNCPGTPANNIIGVFNSSTTWIASGETSVTLDATVNVTFGDILCASTSAGVSHDNGTVACATGEWVGIVKTTASSVSSATAMIVLR